MFAFIVNEIKFTVNKLINKKEYNVLIAYIDVKNFVKNKPQVNCYLGECL